jgi:hypothetical protein
VAVATNGYATYINGAEVRSGTYAASVPLLFDSTHYFAVGSYAYNAYGNGYQFKGNVDELGIFKRVLTAAQIKAIAALANEAALRYNLGEANQLLDLHALGSAGGSGSVTIHGRAWLYDNSAAMAAVGAGNLESQGGAYYLNLDGTAGVMRPTVGTAILLR